MATTPTTRSAEIRATLGHPIIDTDAHMVELTSRPRASKNPLRVVTRLQRRFPAAGGSKAPLPCHSEESA